MAGNPFCSRIVFYLLVTADITMWALSMGMYMYMYRFCSFKLTCDWFEIIQAFILFWGMILNVIQPGFIDPGLTWITFHQTLSDFVHPNSPDFILLTNWNIFLMTMNVSFQNMWFSPKCLLSHVIPKLLVEVSTAKNMRIYRLKKTWRTPGEPLGCQVGFVPRVGVVMDGRNLAPVDRW